MASAKGTSTACAKYKMATTSAMPANVTHGFTDFSLLSRWVTPFLGRTDSDLSYADKKLLLVRKNMGIRTLYVKGLGSGGAGPFSDHLSPVSSISEPSPKPRGSVEEGIAEIFFGPVAADREKPDVSG
jgi:hypothetical protein